MKKIVSLFIALCLLFSVASAAAFADIESDTYFDLAEMYYDRQDYEKAMEWYLKAAEGGNTFAMNNIGARIVASFAVYLWKPFSKSGKIT